MRIKLEPLYPLVSAVLRVSSLLLAFELLHYTTARPLCSRNGNVQDPPLAWLQARPAVRLQATAGHQDDSDRYCTLPASLEGQLMPFQREGVKFALRHGGRALIGDEMGLVGWLGAGWHGWL